MTALEITQQTINNNDFRLDDISNLKCVDIFSADTKLVSGVVTYRIDNIIELISSHEFENLYVHDIIMTNNVKQPSNIKLFIDHDFTNVSFISIYEKHPIPIGVLDLTTYDGSYNSQTQLIEDLFKLSGIYIHEEFVEYNYELYLDDVLEFDSRNHCDEWHSKNYCLTHGDSKYALDIRHDLTDNIDGRLTYYNELEVSNFWDFTYNDYVKPLLCELDPDDTIAVYHRSGKYWYVTYTLLERDVKITHLTDDGELIDDWYVALTYQTNPKLLHLIRDRLISIRDELTIKSYVTNHIMNENNNNYDTTIVNHDLLSLLYGEDLYELTDAIYDNISWDLDKFEESFTQLYYQENYKHMSTSDDLSIVLSTFDGDKTYDHLQRIKRFGNTLNYELIKSDLLWVIKKDSHEYHFDILEVLTNDITNTESLHDFVKYVLQQLFKRQQERISDSELFDKASKIFVSCDDSIESGNCKIGTQQFMLENYDLMSGFGGIRGDVLLNISNTKYTKRAVYQAILSHGSHINA